MAVDVLPVEELLRTIPDPFVVFDDEFRFTFVNEPAAELIGASAAELRGCSLWDRFPHNRGTALEADFEHAMRAREAVTLTTFDRPRQRWYSIRLQPYRAGLAVFVHDVTEVKRDEERWARIADIRTALHKIAAQVAADAPPEQTYELVCADSARLVDAAGSWLLRFTNGSYCVLARAVPDECASDQDPRGSTHRVLPGSELERMRRSGRSLVVTEGLRGRLARHGLRAAIFVPIELGGASWGALVVGWSRPRPDAREALPWLEELTQLVAAGLSSAEARAELARHAATDPLTGLDNRRAFDEALEHSVARAERHGHAFALALLDVDEFKQINDAHGHDVGDAVLRAVAGQLSAASRGEDVAARLGGDEFALVLDGVDASAALGAVQRLRERIAVALSEAGLPRATVCAGVAAWRPHRTPTTLLHDADVALYRAKRQGRDAVALHGPAPADAERGPYHESA